MQSQNQSHRKIFLISGIIVIIAGILFLLKILLLSYVAAHIPAVVSGTVSSKTTVSILNQASSQNISSSTPELIINDKVTKLEIADTQAKQVQGLSDRENLPEDSGMLFVFDKPNKTGFWMKDMHFSLDMIWLDENYKVITVKQNISPETYPEVFYPDSSALFVLEVNAGFVKENSIKVGSVLDIRK